MSLLPQVRANWLKYTVRSAKNYATPDGPRILDAIGTELRGEIRKAPPLAWVPVAYFIDVCKAVREAVGLAGAHAFWRRSLCDSIDQPLIRPLAVGAMYLFGNSPRALYRRTPQAWALVMRRAGEMSTAPGPVPESIWLQVRGLPEECRSQALLNMWEGGFQGEAEFLKFQATVETNDERLMIGSAEFLVRWTKP